MSAKASCAPDAISDADQLSGRGRGRAPARHDAPKRFRGPSMVHHLEHIAFRGVPIIVLISFLVGAILAQQALFQLNASAPRRSWST
jgi:hypothetical protein